MKVIIIGGGASGMTAALCAARLGHEVEILEGKDRIGKKILQTGNGRCNLSNSDQSVLHYHGLYNEYKSRAFVQSVFAKITQSDMLSFFNGLGLEFRTRNGYQYPASEQASAVLDCLRFALIHEGVHVNCCAQVMKLRKEQQGIIVHTKEQTYQADRVIFATGSKAGLQKGDVDGYAILRECGHRLMGPIPALVQLISDEKIFKPLSGIRVNAKIRLLDENGTELCADTGELQLTAYGLSGIPTLQISHLASKYLTNGKKVCASIDYLPDLLDAACLDILKKRAADNGYKTADQFLIGMFHKNLGQMLMKMSDISLSKQASAFSETDLLKLCNCIKDMRVPLNGTKGFAQAQICAGGVLLDEIKDTLESKVMDGLYLCGEVLDVHGDCGGYNLQWAFISGMFAASNIS